MKYILPLILYLLLPLALSSQTHFVQAEGNFVLKEGYLVLTNSHFTNNADFSSSDGTVKMSGNAATDQTTIGGSNTTTFNQLEIAKTANDVALAQAAKVEGQLTLSGGLLDLKTFDLTLLDMAPAIAGAANNRYIKTSATGQLKMSVGTTETTFPVGNSSYNPAKVSNAGTADVFGLRVEDGVKTQLGMGTTIAHSTVSRVWQVTEAVAGGTDLSMNVAWQTAEELTDFDRSKTHFAHYNGSKWVSNNNGAAAGSNPYNFTGTNISTLGAFSLGNTGCASDGPTLIGITPPTIANAGLDMTAICGEATMLTANAPTVGMGKWSIISGDDQRMLDDSEDPMSLFSGGIGEQYTLEWAVAIADAICPVSKDRVLISFDKDSDADMVQDCVDLCNNGDDAQNADGDYLPDACDCLPNLENDIVVENGAVSLNGYITPGTYIANQELNSTGKVFGPGVSTVTFKAGQIILLKPGFHAEAGCEFLAHIGDCEPVQTIVAETPLAKTIVTDKVHVGNAIDFSVYPNPFSNKSKVQIEVAASTAVSVGLYNQQGRLLRRLLVNQYLETGTYNIGLNGANLIDGLYYIAVKTKTTQLVKKVIAQNAGGLTNALD